MAVYLQLPLSWESLTNLAWYAFTSSLLLASVYLFQNEVFRYTRRIRNLGGPRGWPIVGNLFQVFAVSTHFP